MSSAPTAYVAFPITSNKSPATSSVAFNDVSSTNKKKFGKNLSKLIKQPEPLTVDSTSPSKNSVSRNGLLLLSTKRGGPVSSSLATGLLNTKTSVAPKPINTFSLKSESALSTIGNSVTTPVVWQLNHHQGIDDPKVQAAQQDTTTPEDHIVPLDTATDIYRNGTMMEESVPSGDQQIMNSKQETQEDYMARLARERSEKRKLEEEMRIREQRERAERRLMELESKRNSLQQSVHKQTTSETALAAPKSFYTRVGDHDTNDEYVDTDMGNWRSRRANLSSQINSMKVNGYDDNHEKRDSSFERERFKSSHPTRSLFDPYRPSTTGSGRVHTQSNSQDNHDAVLANDEVNFPESVESAKPNDLPVEQVSSYDGISRAERNNTSSTRMLFDPKSGSMVSVRVRDDAESARPKKDKGKIKSKSSKEKDLSKKNEAKESKKLKKRLERKDGSKQDENLQNDHSLNVSRLPRTRGVLYKRETDGSVISVDGCDGDQGFGSHSVPGGRVRNASAHSELMERQFTTHNNGANIEKFNETTFHERARQSVKQSPPPEQFYAGLTDYAGSRNTQLTREHFMKNQSSKKVDGSVSFLNADLPWHLRVKPNEKIELVTGIDESPTLQATAAAWAPSQLTMAAIKNALPCPQTPDVHLESQSDSSELDEISESEVPALTLVDLDGAYEDEGVEEDDESPSMRGLGFDPALNMDSVMMSPAFGQSDFEPSLNLDSLNLTDSAVNHLDIGSSTNFLTTAWPSSGSLRTLNNWDYSKNTAKPLTTDEVPVSLNAMSSASVSSFLSLSLTKGEQGNASTSTHSLLDSW